MAVFGTAYQNMLAAQGKGGGLTGQAAVAALLDAVPTGQVRSSDLLPFVSEEMQRRAAPKLDIARETSQGWQGRLANQRTGWAMIASEAGVEEGQRNFFRFFTQWMNENQDIPERFGKFWKDFSEQFVIAGGFGGLLREVLGGEENIISEWLGSEKTEQFRENFAILTDAASSAASALGLLAGGEAQTSKWKIVSDAAAGYVKAGAGLVSLDPAKVGEGVLDILHAPSSYITGKFKNQLASEAEERRIEDRNRLASGKQPLTRYGGIRDFPRYAGDFVLDNLFLPEQGDFSFGWGDESGRPAYHPRGLELLTAGQGGGAGQSVNINIEGVTVTAPESSDPEAFADRFTNALEDALNRAMPGLNR